jgi:DNA-binding CsgD family transcriptional regulator
MLPARKPAEQARPTAACDTAMFVVDFSLKVVACDRAAARMIRLPNGPAPAGMSAARLPDELANLLRGRNAPDIAAMKAHCRVGETDYAVRAFIVNPHGGQLMKSLIVLHLQTEALMDDAAQIAARYNFTHREGEAFAGILAGLSTKELADRMNVSPNTIKAFVRLIMIKMGVTTRAGIISAILRSRTTAAQFAERAGKT